MAPFSHRVRLLGAVCVAGWVTSSVACTFPGYSLGGTGANVGAAAGTQSGGGGSGGDATGGGGVAGGGAPGVAGSGGASTGGSQDPQGETAAWSGSALDRFSFLLLGKAHLETDSVTLTRQPDEFAIGGIAQRLPIRLDQGPGFHVAVGFRIESTGTPGDGLAIVFHDGPNGARSLGTAGGGLGYQGLKPCFAIELDTATGGSSELQTPHVAMVNDCDPGAHGATMSTLAGDPLDGGEWSLSVDWDSVSTMMDLKLTNLASGQSTSINDTVDLSKLLGSQTFVAVTAATGAFSSTHRLTSLQLRGGGVTERTLTNVGVSP